MKKYLGIICLLYSSIIFYVWISGSLKNYLSLQMQLYLKLLAVPLFIIGIVLIINKNINYKFKINDLILVLPIVMLISSGDGKLTLNLASNRMGNFSSSNIKAIVEDEVDESDTQEEVIDESIQSIEVSNEVDYEIIDENYEYLANYFTFSEKALRFKGKSIRVKGFSVTNADYLPSGFFALGKYIISCCTADASFSGFYVKYDMSKIKNNTWYEIEGVLNSGRDPSGHSIMYLNVTNIKEIVATDEEQYAYPCYVYDGGLCREVTKYDIDFEV